MSGMRILAAPTSTASNGDDPPVEPAGLPPRRAGRARRIALVFLYAWTVYTLIQGGALLVREPYLHVLATAPRAVQEGAGYGYAQTLIKLERTLPYDTHVLLVWRRPEKGVVGFWYGYFWATYWLYPRQVDIVTESKAPDSAYGIVLDVRSRSQPEGSPPIGYAVDSTYAYADQVVTVLTAVHG